MENNYNGVDRRITQRRQIADRRNMIRFEPELEPRRSGKDRRSEQSVWDNRNGF